MNNSYKFNYDDRVITTSDCHWGGGITGTISSDEPRIIYTTRGQAETYFVTFDVPQRDPDGDGPYFMAEIEARFFKLVP